MSVLQDMKKRVPAPLRSRLLNLPLVGGVLRKLREQRVMTIPAGVGAGLKFSAGPSNPAYMDGSNERPVQNALADLIQPGDVFYDIGANVGFFTVIGARLVGEHGRVVAFEPLPKNVDLLRKNIAQNQFQNVTVIGAAVTNRSGKGELQVSSYSGGSSLSTAAPPPDLIGTLQVNLVSVDELISAGYIPPPRGVKIDVEGAEIEVLLGMVNTILQHRPWVIYEIDDTSTDAYHRKAASCQAFLAELGYQIESLQDSYPGNAWLVGNYLARPALR